MREMVKRVVLYSLLGVFAVVIFVLALPCIIMDRALSVWGRGGGADI